jgi:transcriptional regulator with XRE-family HTH domain
MPERSFGRTIRFRRTKLGLSQAKLGELVGRSPSTIRSWERDDSTPNDPDVLMALTAVLGVEQRTLFEKAGVDTPETETSPTVEQELATLRPPPAAGGDDPDDGVRISFTYEELAGLGDDEEEVAPRSAIPGSEVVADTDSPDDEVDQTEDDEEIPSFHLSDRSVPGYIEPRPDYVVTRLTQAQGEQGYGENSYVEDPSERQLYRVRTVGTAVGVVVLLLLLMYAAGKGIEAFGDWWDSFFGQLRL